MDSASDDPPLEATWAKYIVLARFVNDLPIRRKRHAFLCMRKTPNATADTFMPGLGITAGEFCVFHALGMNQSRR